MRRKPLEQLKADINSKIILHDAHPALETNPHWSEMKPLESDNMAELCV